MKEHSNSLDKKLLVVYREPEISPHDLGMILVGGLSAFPFYFKDRLGRELLDIFKTPEVLSIVEQELVGEPDPVFKIGENGGLELLLLGKDGGINHRLSDLIRSNMKDSLRFKRKAATVFAMEKEIKEGQLPIDDVKNGARRMAATLLFNAMKESNKDGLNSDMNFDAFLKSMKIIDDRGKPLERIQRWSQLLERLHENLGHCKKISKVSAIKESYTIFFGKNPKKKDDPKLMELLEMMGKKGDNVIDMDSALDEYIEQQKNNEDREKRGTRPPELFNVIGSTELGFLMAQELQALIFKELGQIGFGDFDGSNLYLGQKIPIPTDYNEACILGYDLLCSRIANERLNKIESESTSRAAAIIEELINISVSVGIPLGTKDAMLQVFTLFKDRIKKTGGREQEGMEEDIKLVEAYLEIGS